jgi:hypothetical protein
VPVGLVLPVVALPVRPLPTRWLVVPVAPAPAVVPAGDSLPTAKSVSAGGEAVVAGPRRARDDRRLLLLNG